MKKTTFLSLMLISAIGMQAQTTAYQFRSVDGNFFKMSTVTLFLLFP